MNVPIPAEIIAQSDDDDSPTCMSETVDKDPVMKVI